ncbi:ABATE domain-containing protein [Mycobacterium sp. M26]|uniref:CGNR zinc finger domain-containing protein n=1 Tax=Mycobacterium sp. M26 TaxID=1762962 RepID=UPI00073EEC26|nr:ABATE domain-containing protein [Mycobacterium sp. M26]
MNSESLLKNAQAAGFVVAGEPLAVDLADTIITAQNPPADLLANEATCRLWWELQRDRLPQGAPLPPLDVTVEIRGAVREILDAHLTGASPGRAAVEQINGILARVPATRQLVHNRSGWTVETARRASADRPYDLALAAVADSLTDLLVSPSVDRLRRCQNPACSMLFVASDARRKFCTQNICANRTRVARHYRRHRAD